MSEAPGEGQNNRQVRPAKSLVDSRNVYKDWKKILLHLNTSMGNVVHLMGKLSRLLCYSRL